MGSDAAAAEQFGPYLVYERLGVGGMAQVHRALERGIEGFERVVALKRLLPHLAVDASFIKSFVREAKLASQLNHVNIVQIFELGRVGSEYFISMEYIDGRDIRRILRHARRVSGPPPIQVTVGLLLQLCDALDYAHNKVDDSGTPMGLVHRDVSPSNVLVTSAGAVKVIDFGIAKAQSAQLRTQTGRVKGKLAYMAPEALAGKDLDARSDLFAAGVIAHELVTARPLFATKNEYQTLMKVQRGEIMPPSTFNQACPAELDAIILRALARDPDERFLHASDMRDELLAMRKQYNLQTSDRDIAMWLEWAFSLEAPSGNFTASHTFDPANSPAEALAASRRPSSKIKRTEEDESIDLAWGAIDDHNAGAPVLLDDVPDVSDKHLASARELGAEVRLDFDEPGFARRGSAAESQRGVVDEPGFARRGSAAESQRGVVDEPGFARRGSAAESQRGVGDDLPKPRRDEASARPTPRPKSPTPAAATAAALLGPAPRAKSPTGAPRAKAPTAAPAPTTRAATIGATPSAKPAAAKPAAAKSRAEASAAVATPNLGMGVNVRAPRVRAVTIPPLGSSAPATRPSLSPPPPVGGTGVAQTLPDGVPLPVELAAPSRPTPVDLDIDAPSRPTPMGITPPRGVPSGSAPPYPHDGDAMPTERAQAIGTPTPRRASKPSVAPPRAQIAVPRTPTPPRPAPMPAATVPPPMTVDDLGSDTVIDVLGLGGASDTVLSLPANADPEALMRFRAPTASYDETATQPESERVTEPRAPGAAALMAARPQPSRTTTPSTIARTPSAGVPSPIARADSGGVPAPIGRMPSGPVPSPIARVGSGPIPSPISQNGSTRMQQRPVTPAALSAFDELGSAKRGSAAEWQRGVVDTPPPSQARKRLITPATALFAEPEAEHEIEPGASSIRPAATVTQTASSHAPARPSIAGLPRRRGRAIALIAGAAVLGAGLTAGALYVTRTPTPATDEPHVQVPIPPPATTGTVTFSVMPTDAAITVDGQAPHIGNNWTLALAPGVHQVEVHRDGYKTWLTSADVAVGQHRTLQVALEPLDSAVAESATLIIAPPADREVLVDDTALPPGPQRAPLTLGAHTVVVRKDGVEVWRTTLDARASAVYDLTPLLLKHLEAAPAPINAGAGSAEAVEPSANHGATNNGSAVEATGAGSATAGSAAAGSAAVDTNDHAGSARPPAPREPTGIVAASAVTKHSGAAPTIPEPLLVDIPSTISAKLCIDENGRVTSTTVVTPVVAATASAITSALDRWTYEPYRPDGVARPACFVVGVRVK